MSDSLDDPFIQELLDDFGPLGYMFWFGTLEIIAKENGHNLTGKIKISQKVICRKLRTKWKHYSKFIHFCQSKTKILCKTENNNVIIHVLNMQYLKDNYTKDLQVANKKPSHQSEVEVEEDKEKNTNILPDTNILPNDKPTEQEKKTIQNLIKQLEKIVLVETVPTLNILKSNNCKPHEMIFTLEQLIKYKPDRPRHYAFKVLHEYRQAQNAQSSIKESQLNKIGVTEAKTVLKNVFKTFPD